MTLTMQLKFQNSMHIATCNVQHLTRLQLTSTSTSIKTQQDLETLSRADYSLLQRMKSKYACGQPNFLGNSGNFFARDVYIQGIKQVTFTTIPRAGYII